MLTAPLEIIWQDEDLLLVNKPPGLAVHRSRLVGADDDYLIDRLRRQIDGPLHLAHRLDRGTSGIMVVARSPSMAAQLGRQWMAGDVARGYLAICRGWPALHGTVERPLSGASRSSPRREARTDWERLATTEVPIALGRYETQRYSLLKVHPVTGRYRQIRRHLSWLSHPIIGDSSHGRNEHNRLFRQHLGSHRLLLHATDVDLHHPRDGGRMHLHARLDDTWRSLLQRFEWLGAVNPEWLGTR